MGVRSYAIVEGAKRGIRGDEGGRGGVGRCRAVGGGGGAYLFATCHGHLPIVHTCLRDGAPGVVPRGTGRGSCFVVRYDFGSMATSRAVRFWTLRIAPTVMVPHYLETAWNTFGGAGREAWDHWTFCCYRNTHRS